jgi:membrane fusion protein, adhesin transport system
MSEDTKVQTELTSVSADLVEYSSRSNQMIIYTICGLIAGSLTWSYFTKVLEVAAASGMVVPTQHVQIIQSLEGGAVQKIFVHAGDHVKSGDALVSLESSQSGASRDELTEQLAGQAATAARLKALLDEKDPEFPNTLKQSHPVLVQQSLEQFKTSRAEIENALASVDQQIAQRTIELSEVASRLATGEQAQSLVKVDLDALRKLQKAKAAGRAEVQNALSRYNEIAGQNEQLRLSQPRLKAAIADLKNQRAEKLNAYRSRLSEMLNDAQVKIAALGASLSAQQKRFDQTLLRSSTDGIVKTIKTTSEGQVIRPGEEVAEIVPDGNHLYIQARVKPEDIAFLREGMSALVKLSAYDYSIFGSIAGTLKRVAADSTVDDKGQVFYQVEVALPNAMITRHNEQWPIKSGMVASVEIVTGERSVFQYITKPIHRMATMALKER